MMSLLTKILEAIVQREAIIISVKDMSHVKRKFRLLHRLFFWYPLS